MTPRALATESGTWAAEPFVESATAGSWTPEAGAVTPTAWVPSETDATAAAPVVGEVGPSNR